MSEFPHDHIKPFSDGSGKKQQVSEMFDEIAGRYDFMNRFLSAGIDISWRKKAIGELKKENPQHILDIATGTGDMAIMASKMLKPARITGIDISPKMLEIGRKKVAGQSLPSKIELLSGDGETIAFPDNTFNAAMIAFGIRNFENLQQGVSEILRVLKPGARLIVLEFSKPKMGLLSAFYRFYMSVVAPSVAKAFRRNKRAYEYLNESSRAFPDREQFTAVLQKAGFTETSYKAMSMGICCIYRGRKPA